MSGITITCGFCGHQADIDRFCSTPIGGELPKDVYQCPACSRAIERRMGRPIVYSSGFVAPGKITLVPVEGRL